ncbi:hypothetical protein [Nodosilinea nodulosa]|uniref:hypothetical protein n=1 Tax=Nodosilinea nodulosa TaxID=416001 RepID=UPI000474BA34|nr:hypothetical protein [Nodosilinea nodulosa]
MTTQTSSTPVPITMHSGPSFGPPPEPTVNPTPTPETPEPQPNPGPIITINDQPPPPTLPPTGPMPTFVDVICIPCTDISQTQDPVIEFGSGGPIPPASFQIFADGRIVAEGATLKTQTLSPLTVQALVQLANALGFWTFPEFSAPPVPGNSVTQFVQITLPCTRRLVKVQRGADEGPFAELFSLLTELVGFSRTGPF